jgi:hypothetical protein
MEIHIGQLINARLEETGMKYLLMMNYELRIVRP